MRSAGEPALHRYNMQLKHRHTIRDDWKMFGNKVRVFTCMHTYLLVIFGTSELRRSHHRLRIADGRRAGLLPATQLLRCQYLYFCTRKASKLSTDKRCTPTTTLPLSNSLSRSVTSATAIVKTRRAQRPSISSAVAHVVRDRDTSCKPRELISASMLRRNCFIQPVVCTRKSAPEVDDVNSRMSFFPPLTLMKTVRKRLHP